MAESNIWAKGGVLMGVAAIITAVVPLLTSTADAKASKANDKTELVFSLLKQRLDFMDKEMTEIKADNKELQEIIRKIYLLDRGRAGGVEVSLHSDERVIEQKLNDIAKEPAAMPAPPQLPSPDKLDDLLAKKAQ